MTQNKTLRDEPLEPLVLATAPDWDEPFKPTNQWGELTNIKKLSPLIEQTATLFRQNKPKSDKDLITIKRSIKFPDVALRGGVFVHSDFDMWVTYKTGRPIMRILCSMRNLKPQIEKTLGPTEARNLYHDLAHAFRYVIEPPESEKVEEIFKCSGTVALSGPSVMFTRAKNVFRVFGYVFVGEDPIDGYKNRIVKILDTLNATQVRPAEAQAAERPEEGAETNIITLPERQLKVLRHLDKSTTAKMQTDIAMETEAGNEKTVSLIIKELKKCHFVNNPRNHSKGTIITQKGREYLRKLDSRKQQR